MEAKYSGIAGERPALSRVAFLQSDPRVIFTSESDRGPGDAPGQLMSRSLNSWIR